MTDFNVNFWLNQNDEAYSEKNVAPQKSNKVTNPSNPTDLYQQVEAVVTELNRRRICLTDDYQDWLKVGFSLVDAFGEGGRGFFHDLSRMSAKYNAADCDKKFDNLLKSGGHGTTISSLFFMVKEAGVDIRPFCSEADVYAPSADTHGFKENDGEYNSLIICDNINIDNQTSPCGCAGAADEAPDINFESTFSNKIDEDVWCTFLRTVVDTMDTPEGKDKMLLATLNLISGCIPNYYGFYGGKVVYSSLYFIYYGPAGSLKGEIAIARHLLTPLKNEVYAQYAMEMDAYNKEHALWEAKNGKKERAERGPEPQKPEFRTPLIPGDSSASKVIRLMKSNGQLGAVIFETEASVVNDTLGAEYGKQIINLLLKAAHHEPCSITRVIDDIYLEIEEPVLATGLTCTPGLLHKLFPSFENGLGSRFLFYGLNRKIGFANPFKKVEKPLDDVYKDLGKKFLELHHVLMNLGDRRIQFMMSDVQEKEFYEYFSRLLEEQFSMLGEGVESFIYRLALQGFRIAMILTLLRRFSDWDRSRPLFDEKEQAINCNEKDFRIMITIVDTLINHTAKIYASLNKDEERNIFKHHVQLSSAERQLYDALPFEYNTEIIREKVQELGFNQRTAERYVGDFVNKHRIAKRITTGRYCKINLKKQ